jgi:hypothetical protein
MKKKKKNENQQKQGRKGGGIPSGAHLLIPHVDAAQLLFQRYPRSLG